MTNAFGQKSAAARANEAAAIQREQMAKQEAIISKQEAGIASQQSDLAKMAMASSRARRRGGLRGLLSTERMDAESGIPTRSTLGSEV